MDCNEDNPARRILDAGGMISLAASPTFAIMAFMPFLGGGAPDMLCSAAMQDSSPLSGMVPMYLLMSAFHSAPWLKLISGRRGRPDQASCKGSSAVGVSGWQGNAADRA